MEARPSPDRRPFDDLPTPGHGRLALSPCPGRRHGQSDPHTALAADLDAIRDWGAGALLCLVEPHELETLGVAALPSRVRARGIDFHHLPIPDYGVPDAAFEDRWLLHGEHLRRRLRDGGRVLVHCMGGLGRSGTLAVRLLAELGEAPGEALRRVRSARQGAIENEAQAAHALAARPPAEHHGRVLGALLGGALGDAFGHAVELDGPDRIRERFGPRGLREPLAEDGRLVASDDTQMTLFTVEALALALAGGQAASLPGVLEQVRRGCLDWLLTQDADATLSLPPSAGNLLHEPLLHVSRSPGHTSIAALHAGGDGSPERPINDARGCGGVVRVAPLGFLPHRLDADAAAELGLRAAALTHGHADGHFPAALMAACVRELVAGCPLDEALDRAVAAVARHEGAAGTLRAVARARELAAAGTQVHEAAVASLGAGWNADEALAVGVYAALAGDGLREVLAIAANQDGDSDAAAGLAGQLHGASRGVAELPLDWLQRLDLLAPALRTLRALYRADADAG